MIFKNYAYFLQILDIASILDNYIMYFQKNKNHTYPTSLLVSNQKSLFQNCPSLKTDQLKRVIIGDFGVYFLVFFF